MMNRDKAEQLLRKARVFILSAVNSNGYPILKAVLPSKIRGSFNEIYFVTNTHSNYVNAITNNCKAGVYYYNSLLFKGCLLTGEMRVITDEKTKARLWKNAYKSAYPESNKKYHDPDFCVLKFTPRKGRYYYMFTSTDFDL